MENLEIYNKVRSVPQEAQKKIGGGKLNGMTDINPMWRIKTLTEQFGPVGYGWYYEIADRWFEPTNTEEVGAFIQINLYVKYGDEWSKPIVGIGGNTLVAKEKGVPRLSDEAYKKALTDAISVACKALGIGADVYWNADKTKYTTPTAEAPAIEYKCDVCGKPFKDSIIKGKKYTADVIYAGAKAKNPDGIVRCKECREKHEKEVSGSEVE